MATPSSLVHFKVQPIFKDHYYLIFYISADKINPLYDIKFGYLDSSRVTLGSWKLKKRNLKWQKTLTHYVPGTSCSMSPSTLTPPWLSSITGSLCRLFSQRSVRKNHATSPLYCAVVAKAYTDRVNYHTYRVSAILHIFCLHYEVSKKLPLVKDGYFLWNQDTLWVKDRFKCLCLT